MSQEAINVIGAGADTTAGTLMTLMYYLGADRVRTEKLKEELRSVGLSREGEGNLVRVELGMVERLVYLVSTVAFVRAGERNHMRLM